MSHIKNVKHLAMARCCSSCCC